MFHIYVNNQLVGTLGEADDAEKLLIEARRNVASASDSLLFMQGDLRIEGEERLYGEIDDRDTVVKAMEQVLRGTISETIQSSCTVKIEEYMVNLNNLDEARRLLQAAIDLYDQTGNFVVELEASEDRNFNFVMPKIVDMSSEALEEAAAVEEAPENVTLPTGGVSSFIADWGLSEIEDTTEMALEDYELGVLSMDFLEDVEITRGYLPSSQVTKLSEAIEYVTKEQETAGEYIVQSGDTLSGISYSVNIPMENLVALNHDKLDSVNSTLHIGDVLTITVPEPELSVKRTERRFVEEVYDAAVIYVDNDSWYTTQQVVLQQPSAGYRRAVIDVTCVNDKEVATETVQEEILLEAVPKIVERGTMTPPTYVKPISGGRISSYFGYRKAPGNGGTSNHQGIDWATPMYTPVYASCGGVVQTAGWTGGYGNCVIINHPDGRQTRYAHNSYLTVSAGQTVKQGDLIAYSGSTGNSTGPHVHFEIRIGGVPVNPLDYL